MFLKNAFVAGLVATVVLSLAMALNAFLQFLPAFDVIEMIHRLTGGPMLDGWLGHALMGIVIWPLLFAALQRRLPGRHVLVRGLWFGGFAWAAMMLLFLPIVGAGFFGVVISGLVPLLALVLHLLYGGVLGLIYRRG